MLIYAGFKQAIILMARGDLELWRIAWLSLEISVIAVLISMVLGIPLGTWLSNARFFGRRLIISFINMGMGLPPVVVGLAVTIFFWRSGPFGWMRLLYTPAAMVVAQVVIAFPIVTGITLAAMQQLDHKLRLQALSLGASRWQVTRVLWREARLPLLTAIMAGFGGVISEVGAVLMVGGNIKDDTRVLTTAIVLETRMGRFERAIALAIILLVLVFGVNLIITYIQQQVSQDG